jgi:hypothetical protein
MRKPSRSVVTTRSFAQRLMMRMTVSWVMPTSDRGANRFDRAPLVAIREFGKPFFVLTGDDDHRMAIH